MKKQEAGTAPSPASATPQAPSDHKKWTVIYPVYINSRKTVQEGRRIGKTEAVENPSVNEIAEVCARDFGLRCYIEMEKCYSRDFLLKGRVKVCIRGDDKKPLNPEIPSKKALLHAVCKKLPAARQNKGSDQKGKGKGKKKGGR